MVRRPITALDRRIAKRLSVRRKLYGISAERMADVCHMSVKSYQQLEAAQSPIALDQVNEFAELLNVPRQYFLLEET